MLRKYFFISILFAIHIGLFGCQHATQSAPMPQPTNQKMTVASTAMATDTPDSVSLEIETWLDKAIDPDSFPTDGCIIVHFNQPMDSESAPFPLRINPYIEGVYVWSEDFQSLTFLPIKEFKRLTEYRVRISSDLFSSTGEPLAEFPQWRLQTDASADQLSACSQIAADASTTISVTSNSTTYFSRRPYSKNLSSRGG